MAKVKSEPSSKHKRALIIPDCHIPFEDKKAYELMLKCADDVQPDEVVILGDYADFFNVTAHPKELDISTDLIDEVDAVQARLMELRAMFPKAKIVYIQGNHEFRLERYIRDKARELFGVVTIDTLLNLKALNIHHVPYGPNQKYHVLGSKLIARHEPISGGTHVAHGTVVKALSSVIFGHTHRLQESQIVAIDGGNYRGISAGWLGDSSHSVMSYVKNHHQWALGFSIVTVLPCGNWYNQLVHIIDYKCQVDGKIYHG